MRTPIRSLNDVLTTAVLWLFSVFGLSKFVGSGSWRWSVIIVGGGCAALLINWLIVHLYSTYAPDRLKDRTIHLAAKENAAENGVPTQNSR